MLGHCRKALSGVSLKRTKALSKRPEGRQTRRSFATGPTKLALIMDANGIIYKRNEKKLVALARFLEDTGRYEFPKLDVPNLKLVAQNLDNASEDANKGIITAEQYYMTLLLSLPIQPVDFAGALNAIRGAEYNISLFPDIEDALIELKRTRGVKLGVVTDSMATTAEKKKWMEQAGLNTDIFDVIVNSSDMGTHKPDPLMYNETLSRLGVSPHQAAFLGHRGSELDGAKAVGLTTLVMFPDEDLLSNRGTPLAKYDYFVPGWRHVNKLPLWPEPKITL